MTPTKTSSSVLKKIQEQHLKQKGKAVFLLRRSLFWILFGFSALFGAKAIALTIHIITMEDMQMFMMQRPPIRILAHALPLFWIGFFILFIIAASWCLQHTPKGYKWTLPRVLSVNILLSILLGVVFFQTGLARVIDRQIIHALRPGLSAENFRQRTWQHPENGLMRGIIMDPIDETQFILQGPEGKVWKIEYSSGALKRGVSISSGSWIRLHGEVTEDDVFSAEGIVPDIPPRFEEMGLRRPKGRGMQQRRPPPIF